MTFNAAVVEIGTLPPTLLSLATGESYLLVTSSSKKPENNEGLNFSIRKRFGFITRTI